MLFRAPPKIGMDYGYSLQINFPYLVDRNYDSEAKFNPNKKILTLIFRVDENQTNEPIISPENETINYKQQLGFKNPWIITLCK